MTVYVLGAGASRHVGYPLAKDMGQQLFHWMRRQPGTVMEYPDRAAFFEETFGPVTDFEDFLSRVDGLIAAYEHGTREERLLRAAVVQARGSIGQALREWFSEIRQQQAPAYSRFAERIVQPGDTVIAFNYDLSLDRELKLAGRWSVGDGYGFTISDLPQNSPVKLLKLHGSTNWLAVMFGGVTAGPVSLSGGVFGSRPVIPKDDLTFLGYTELADAQVPAKVFALPVMILPVRDKVFYFDSNMGQEWEWFWDSLWDQAAEVLGRTERLVMCGYGLLPVDIRARDLLLNLANRDATIEVACGADTTRIVAEYHDHGFTLARPAMEVLFEPWVQRTALGQ